jgi:hypothetical protein
VQSIILIVQANAERVVALQQAGHRRHVSEAPRSRVNAQVCTVPAVSPSYPRSMPTSAGEYRNHGSGIFPAVVGKWRFEGGTCSPCTGDAGLECPSRVGCAP